MRLLPLLLLPLLASCGDGDGTGPDGDTEARVTVAYPDLSFDQPVGVHALPSGNHRLLVLERDGVIRVFLDDPSANAAEVFLDLRDRVNASGSEEGLLGLAFHPDFQGNGLFYLHYTASGPRRVVVSEWVLEAGEPDKADPGSERVILEVPQPFSNHNGGQLAFGPDGYLYIALGDGGGSGDPAQNGQDRTTLPGSILRIDVDAPAGGRAYGIPSDNPFTGNDKGYREEIYAYGFRNPWRFSFDPQTGDLWVGDVGQGELEEIDLVEAGGNYGWNVMEGSDCFEPPSNCPTQGLTLPVAEYRHSEGISVTGGHVYRGSEIPSLVGRYVYGDFGTGRIWTLDAGRPGNPQPRELLDSDLNISSFGLDGDGEILIVDFGGRVHRLEPRG